MKERPILFSGPMVCAILEGRKTQTRRIVNPQPEGISTFEGVKLPYWNVGGFRTHATANNPIHCPYGVPGDQLWVREKLNILDWDDSGARLGAFVQYAADESPRGWTHDDDGVDLNWGAGKKTVPSMFMPRWASRITLELLQVRVERLQEITEDDALAEGVAASEPITQDDIDALVGGSTEKALTEAFGTGGHFTAKFNYSMLWDDINRKRAAWATNPWVWVLSFKRETSSEFPPVRS